MNLHQLRHEIEKLGNKHGWHTPVVGWVLGNTPALSVVHATSMESGTCNGVAVATINLVPATPPEDDE